MARYIDAEDVLEAISIEHGKRNDQEEKAILDAWVRIKKIPSADVVEVVRCCECKYSRPRNKSEKNIYFEGVLICESCEMADEPCAVCSDDFCSYGERSETNAE